MSFFPVLFADAAKLGMGWGILCGGLVVGMAMVCFPWRRKNATPEEHH